MFAVVALEYCLEAFEGAVSYADRGVRSEFGLGALFFELGADVGDGVSGDNCWGIAEADDFGDTAG